jgi:hypothetical protein
MAYSFNRQFGTKLSVRAMARILIKKDLKEEDVGIPGLDAVEHPSKHINL